MSGPNLVKFVRARPWLERAITPFANWYCNAAGYRQMGLRYDDLIPEESMVVQQALKRLSPKESYDRVFRLRRAFQLSLSHQLLPRDEWTKAEEDTHYLHDLIEQVEAEEKEKKDLDALIITKPRPGKAPITPEAR
ncbi:putative ubiquinol-cytochrome c reductase complex 14 kda protein [Phaeomoniella chlamydospora]|uniref:Complex III subunit 7 n=1 Tax=Phaeomoniella chlamydospora TaxID=158046 RepID=A0A0G2EAH7_PHACM|nr:putative ubiquinol-cytochrome c reductase complex 14 kda protein [Phaeomoniella chlamydospora]